MGPSKVMWGKDNEIRDLLKDSISKVDELSNQAQIDEYISKQINLLIEEVEGMIFKEENILFPTSLEKLDINDWVEILKDSNIISLPTGELRLKELMYILNSLPVDITFIDKDDTVKYFSDNRDRIIVRTRSVIGRKVQNCHPPQSLEKVEEILTSFKEGRRDSADFWINFKERLIYIKFFAIRDESRNYLGTMEVTQDITYLRKLEGEKRLLDEGN